MTPQTSHDRTPVSPWERRLLAVLVSGYVAVLVALAWRTGITADEPAHLLSAHLYWHGADTLKPRDMPPMIKIVGGWVAARFTLPIPYDRPDVMASKHEWETSLVMMMRMSAGEIRKVFFSSRLPLLVFPVLTFMLLWWWGRQIFSPLAGLLVALAFMLSPTELGHAVLFKNDHAATFGYLLFWYRGWRFWQVPNWKNAAWLGLALAVALLSKLSMIILVGVAPAIVLARCISRRPPATRMAVLALLAVLLIPYVLSLAACQFETRLLDDSDLASFPQSPRLLRPIVWGAQVFGVLPVAVPLWEGVKSLAVESAAVPVYLLGKVHHNGHPLYFLVALALKVPVPLQLLFIISLVLEGIAIARRRFDPLRLFWLLPPWIYIGLASVARLHLGVRLVLPAMAMCLLSCGGAIVWLMRGRRVLVLAGSFVALALGTVQAYPHLISYFNLWTRGPEHGIDYFADSSIDWGQDMRELAKYVAQRGLKKIRFSYFGMDNPFAYLSDRVAEQVAPPWSDDLALGTIYQPEAGIYAISVSLLPGHMFPPKYRDYFSAFRHREPIARAGYSIYIYEIKE